MSKSWSDWIYEHCIKYNVNTSAFAKYVKDQSGYDCYQTTANGWIYRNSVPSTGIRKQLATLLKMSPDEVAEAIRETRRRRKAAPTDQESDPSGSTEAASRNTNIAIDDRRDFDSSTLSPNKLMQRGIDKHGLYTGSWYSEVIQTPDDALSLVKELDELADSFTMPKLEGGGNEMGEDKKWAEIFLTSPSTGYVVRNKEKRIVAFWFFIPVYKETYDRIISGENVNETITHNDLDVFDVYLGGDYYIYFVDAFIEVGCENSSKVTELFWGSMLTCLRGLAETPNNIFIKAIATHASTSRALSFCRNRGFEFREWHKTHKRYRNDIPGAEPFESTQIFELNIEQQLGSKFFSRDKELQKLYFDHFEAAKYGNGFE